MKKEIIIQLHSNFENSAKREAKIEFWYARDLQVLLGYNEWRNFIQVINKAKQACENSGHSTVDHFVDTNKMVSLGSGSQREVDDIKLTRYACYLIAQNGDPRKDEIAFAQTYFAIQTRKQELIEERISEVERLQAREKLSQSEKQLSGIIFERGVDSQGFARIRSKGDQALFGGKYRKFLHKVTGVKDNKKIKNFTPDEYEKLWKGIEKIESSKKGNVIEVYQVTQTRINKNGTIFCYCIDSEWISKEECLELAKRGQVDLEICISRLGNAYLGSAPSSSFQDNLDSLIDKKHEE